MMARNAANKFIGLCRMWTSFRLNLKPGNKESNVSRKRTFRISIICCGVIKKEEMILPGRNDQTRLFHDLD